MKRVLTIILSLIVLFCFVSCANEVVPEDSPLSPPSKPSPPTTDDKEPIGDDPKREIITVDLSNFSPSEGELLIEVDENSQIQLENFDLSEGFVIEPIIEGQTARGINQYRDIISSDAVHKRENGEFILVPNEDNIASFLSSSLNIASRCKLLIKRMEFDKDFKISMDEPQHEAGKVAQEYYFVNLYDEEWKHLNPEEIVFVWEGSFSTGFKPLHHQMLQKNVNGVYDFSKILLKFFAIDTYLLVPDIFLDNYEAKLYVLSPEELRPGMQPKEVDNSKAKAHVYKVIEQNDGKAYKAVFSFDEENFKKVKNSISNDNSIVLSRARYLDGTLREYGLVPFINDKEKTIEYEM